MLWLYVNDFFKILFAFSTWIIISFSLSIVFSIMEVKIMLNAIFFKTLVVGFSLVGGNGFLILTQGEKK